MFLGASREDGQNFIDCLKGAVEARTRACISRGWVSPRATVGLAQTLKFALCPSEVVHNGGDFGGDLRRGILAIRHWI